MTIIQSKEDREWLKDVHGVKGRFAVAVLYGNEDRPTKIELYAKDDYRTTPRVFVPDEDGSFHEEVGA